MLKSDKAIGRVNTSVFLVGYPPHPPSLFPVAISSLFMKKDDGSLFMEKWVIGLRNGKGGGPSFAHQGLFFLLDSQVI